MISVGWQVLIIAIISAFIVVVLNKLQFWHYSRNNIAKDMKTSKKYKQEVRFRKTKSLKTYRKEVRFKKLCAIEQANEQFVKDLCSKYGLDYSECDGVYGEKEQLDTMETVREMISQRMKVSPIHWLGGVDNCYVFCFYSYEPV